MRARLRAPASKSVTNRLLVMAALADGDSVLRDPLESDDTAAMRAAITALGAEVTVTDDGSWRVCGTAGRPRAPGTPIDCRLSGTTMRFITALAAMADGPVIVTGAAPLLRRPIGPLVAALRALGASVEDRGGFPPLRVSGGGLRGGAVKIDVTASTQFASAVLLVSPYAREGVDLSLAGTGASGYVELTLAAMSERIRGSVRYAEPIDGSAGTVRVEPGGYQARDEAVEHDASAAAHLYALAVATGGMVTVENAAAGSAQPDAAFPDVLAAMGATVTREDAALTVTGPDRPRPVTVDLGATPDQVTTVAALAALADGTTTITAAGVVRGHETDRLRALATELGKLGVAVEERPDGLVIHGGGAHGPASLATYGDHRLAMAFAALAARVPDVAIEDPGCVAKTYPGFWDDLAMGGVTLRWLP